MRTQAGLEGGRDYRGGRAWPMGASGYTGGYQRGSPRVRLQPAYRPRGTRRAEALLGWLSIALGVSALLAPRVISRATGMSERPVLLRAVGARELLSGLGLLTGRNRSPWLWSRVLGDAFDAALIGSAAVHPGLAIRRVRSLGALAIIGAVAAVDLMVSLRHRQRDLRAWPPRR
jgi:hypothetical protein